MLKGFPERIEQITQKKVYEDFSVVAYSERKFSAWIGGSYLATFKDKYFTKKQYEMNPQEFYISDLIF